MSADKHSSDPWGLPPWEISFSPPARALPGEADIVIVGGGFTGLAAAAWLRLLDPGKSVVLLEARSIGSGASGRTGGMVLAETAAGDFPGLGDVLGAVKDIFAKLGVQCDLTLPGAWEVGRRGGLSDSRIDWNDSGALRVVREVPGGTLDPGKLVGGLARAADRLGALVLEKRHVSRVYWNSRVEFEVAELDTDMDTAPRDTLSGPQRIAAAKVLFATNAFSLTLSGLDRNTHPKLTLAALSAPLAARELETLGLSARKPFYTVDLPYLWGRTCAEGSIVWGAGLVDAPPSGYLEDVNIDSGEPARMFDKLEKRIRGLHPALRSARFTHRWGGPILFRDDWRPVFDYHPQSPNAIVIGAFAGHGVALSTYFGAWAAEALLGRRDLPQWSRLSI
jgi:glycine/D-amino acid oxidase-like deaminating enzyme